MSKNERSSSELERVDMRSKSFADDAGSGGGGVCDSMARAISAEVMSRTRRSGGGGGGEGGEGEESAAAAAAAAGSLS